MIAKTSIVRLCLALFTAVPAFAGGGVYTTGGASGTVQNSWFFTVPAAGSASSLVMNLSFYEVQQTTSYQNPDGTWVTIPTGSYRFFTGYANAIVTRNPGGLVYITQVVPGPEYQGNTHVNGAGASLGAGNYQLQQNAQGGAWAQTSLSW